jgi:hypothetical protein
MDSNILFSLIKSFSPVELREVRKFLNSPFFNLRQDLIQLFEYLAAQSTPTKHDVWNHLWGIEPFDDQKLRLHFSYLHRLLEKYIIYKESIRDENANQITLATAYRRRNQSEAFERTRKNIEKALENQPLRNTYYLELQSKLLWETHQQNYTINPTDVSQLYELSAVSNHFHLSQKLRLVCLITAHQTVYHSSAEGEWEKELLMIAEKPDIASIPAVEVYLVCYKMLKYPEEELHFKQFKSILIEKHTLYSLDEIHALFTYALNYCVRKINAHNEKYSQEALDLYKTGLEKGYLFENGILRRFTYYNIVAAGLQSNDLEWVRFFIYEYKNRLEKKYRESLFSFNLARLEYTQKNYGVVLDLLQNSNYRDILLNLSAKTLLLKTYYDLGEQASLESHLDAMRNFIYRKRIIGYHRNNYLNIIKYMEKIIRLPANDSSATAAIKTAIEKEESLSEKSYFLGILSAN